MAPFDYDLAVIGGGAAGLTITAGAAQLGVRTLLIEKEPALGGDCLHFGCVPSKTLIHTARIRHQIGRAGQFGLVPMEMPPVDFSQVAARIQEVISQIQHHDSVERFTGLGARVMFGSPRFLDEHAVLLNGSTISAKTWVVATGSSPAPPRLDCLREIDCLTNREIFSLKRLPETLIVLGAGPIAMEMAQAFCRLGSRVQVVQRSGQILSREDRDMADLVMEKMAEEGVEFFLNSTVTDARRQGEEKLITLETGDGTRTTLRGDQILLAQGRRANIHGLGLKGLGLVIERGALRVDGRMRTSQPHIFAAGDVVGGYQFTHAAGYEGGIVIANAVFHLPRHADYTWMPWCTYTDPELASIGLNEKAASREGKEYRLVVEEFADNDRALAEGEGRGRLKILLGRRDRILGVQIAGPRAGDLISEWAAVLGGRVKLSTLSGIVHPYPTLAEINKRGAGSVLSPKLFSPGVRRILRVLFRYRGQ